MKNRGGQFEPELGGHFQPKSGGQFKSELGGQFDRNLHNMKAIVMKSLNDNSGVIEITNQSIEIKKGRFIKGDTSHPLYDSSKNYFKRIYCLENPKKNIIYFFNKFGTEESNNGFHVGFTKLENQRFLFLQGKHWLQKEENIRYIVNILFLIIGTVIAFLGLSKNE